MGVDISFKGIYGFKNTDMENGTIEQTLLDNLGDTKAEEVMYGSSNAQTTFVNDGMCGEYEYIGVGLFDFDEDNCGESKEFNIKYLSNLHDSLLKVFEHDGINYDEFVEFYGEPMLYFFVHAS